MASNSRQWSGTAMCSARSSTRKKASTPGCGCWQTSWRCEAAVIIYPALDLRGGKVVRLRQGDLAQQTIYSDDPLAIAERWIAAGAQWLHVVNLDGAFAAGDDKEQGVQTLAPRGRADQFCGRLRRR